ncbi:Rab GTPase-activating protein 1-like [Astathelohania contejeani]|uniref:Rab GTPase-activating protein 1-like n=1 Tax=Astathelohania contejeani TaxID=164912 RepID=A0ABQ7HYJ7_9MICR|nr:Rab GTPase-activating protein 1-like [Thelohania contejeani]
MLFPRCLSILLNCLSDMTSNSVIFFEILGNDICSLTNVEMLEKQYQHLIDTSEDTMSIGYKIISESNAYLNIIKNDLLNYNSNKYFFIIYFKNEIKLSNPFCLFIKEQKEDEIKKTDPIIININAYLQTFYKGESGIFSHILLDQNSAQDLINIIGLNKKYYLDLQSLDSSISKKSFNLLSNALTTDSKRKLTSYLFINTNNELNLYCNKIDYDSYSFVYTSPILLLNNDQLDIIGIYEILKLKDLYMNAFESGVCKPIDNNGFVKENDEITIVEMNKLVKNNKEWITLINNIEISTKNHLPIWKYIITKGIPKNFKYILWKKFIYSEVNIDYKVLSLKVCGYEMQIHNDVHRTLRKHSLFYYNLGIGQCILFRILVAYANYNPNIGYCQGMSDFVGILLFYFSEEEAFKMLVNLIEKNGIEGIFDKNFTMHQKILTLQKKKFKEIIPNIYDHISSIGEDMLIRKWYITLFTRFNIELVLRIWDYFLFYGVNVLPLFGVAILKEVEKEILTMDDISLLSFFSELNEYDFDVESIIKFVENHL